MGLLAPGAVLAGYRIESIVGRGGMGVVYRARELELDRVVALKVIAPELVEDDDVRERFLREARAAASIEHPNVIPVHAAGVDEGCAYLAMRFVDGDDARALVRREGFLSAGRAADVIAQAAAGLDAIHRAGYVHRDVKPANVLLDDDGHVYVTDFGLAKQMLTRGAQTTRSGQWVGTLDYVAPEQIRGGRIDARADVYALGGVLCFLLTGRVPFDREGDEAKLWAQLSEPPPVPSHVRPGVPPEFDAVVGRAMLKDPSERFPSAGDLGRAARAAAAGVQSSVPERVVARGAAAPAGAPIEEGLLAESSTLTARRPEALAETAVVTAPARRRLLLPLGLAVAAAAALAISLLSGNEEPTAARDPTPTPTPTATASATPATETIDRVGYRPNGIALAGGSAWVTSGERSEVERIDVASFRKRAPVRIGVGASGIVTDGRHVYIAVKDAKQIVRLDARTGRVTARWDTAGPPSKLALGFGSLWVGTRTNRRSALILRYNRRGEEVSRWHVPRRIAGLATAAGSVWVLHPRPSPRVARFDPRTGSSRDWGPLAANGSMLTVGGGFLWGTLGGEDMVARIDPQRRGVVHSAAGRSPDTAVFAGGHLYVASNVTHEVLVLNPEDGKPADDPVPVPPNPFATAADERYVWVTGTGRNTVTRIAYR